MSAAFFDTNIIFYAADSDAIDVEKHILARDLMRQRLIAVSTQVMMETYGTLRKKLHYGPVEATHWVQTLYDEIVVTLTPNDVMQGLELAHRYKTSHWDGMILRAAHCARTEILYTEDLSHGQTYGDVTVCNPFKEDFLA